MMSNSYRLSSTGTQVVCTANRIVSRNDITAATAVSGDAWWFGFLSKSCFDGVPWPAQDPLKGLQKSQCPPHPYPTHVHAIATRSLTAAPVNAGARRRATRCVAALDTDDQWGMRAVVHITKNAHTPRWHVPRSLALANFWARTVPQIA